MFDDILVQGVSAEVFPAGDPAGLAHALRALQVSPERYEALSRNAQVAWERLQVATRWGDLVRQWLAPAGCSEERAA
jgi:hypothetical protein